MPYRRILKYICPMDSYIVSARKYRPQTFESVVGQSHITDTLKNAIRKQQVGQAFLFCGPRGVGKTTCARILAKTINCQNLPDDLNPCGECESCKGFQENHSFNIHELDAASNNSVDDIRNLVDQVRYAPQVGSKSVYIIDEVHMLSTQAFNAFLKTLEEPPAHAIFIMATTEKHKIIPTILSRCQIYDFKRVGVQDISSHLAYIADKESIKTEPEALHTIALKADGAVRDALSIFDRLVSFSDEGLTYTATIEHLNILDYDYFFKFTDLILEKNSGAALLTFNEVLEKGFDGQIFLGGMASHFRDLLVCKQEATLELLEVTDQVKEKYKEQAGKVPTDLIYAWLEISAEAEVNYRASKNKRLLVELCLLQWIGAIDHGSKKKSDTHSQG